MRGVTVTALRSSQLELLDEPRVVGFARGDLAVVEVHRDIANEVIRANHYSGKVYAASTVHLAVEWCDRLVGVLQYGYAMNPNAVGHIVAGTEPHEYLELNRMWVDDVMPRNTETIVLALSLRYLRATRPAVAWLQTFADERCGGLGVMYQAASFLYVGEHTQRFWELDGEVYHNALMTFRDGPDSSVRRVTKAAAHLQANRERANPMEWRQFRYVKFLKPAWRSRLLLDVLPYPKRAEGVGETSPALQPGSDGAMPSLRSNFEAVA